MMFDTFKFGMALANVINEIWNVRKFSFAFMLILAGQFMKVGMYFLEMLYIVLVSVSLEAATSKTAVVALRSS